MINEISDQIVGSFIASFFAFIFMLIYWFITKKYPEIKEKNELDKNFDEFISLFKHPIGSDEVIKLIILFIVKIGKEQIQTKFNMFTSIYYHSDHPYYNKRVVNNTKYLFIELEDAKYKFKIEQYELNIVEFNFENPKKEGNYSNFVSITKENIVVLNNFREYLQKKIKIRKKRSIFKIFKKNNNSNNKKSK